MTPERRAELRRDYPRPPENTRPDTSVIRCEVNELLDALDAVEATMRRVYKAMNETSASHPGYASVLAEMRAVIDGRQAGQNLEDDQPEQGGGRDSLMRASMKEANWQWTSSKRCIRCHRPGLMGFEWVPGYGWQCKAQKSCERRATHQGLKVRQPRLV